MTETLEFKSAIIKSLLAHVAFALILTVRAFLLPSEPLRLESAIRVDLVGLPDKVRELPPAPVEVAQPPTQTKTLPPVETVKPTITKAVPSKPDPKKSKRDQDAALKRLDAMARLERMARAEAANKAISQAKAAQSAVKGNQISKGNALSGLTRLDHARYLDDLEARIKTKWHPPKFLAKAGLRVRVLLMIDSRGMLLSKNIIQSSGNPVFDESAVAAIEGSLPLPAPPETLQGILASQGVELDLEPMGFR